MSHPEKQGRWSNWTFTIVTVVVTNVLNTFTTLWLMREERPSALIGYISDPPGPVTVTLNNGRAAQVADDLTGWFGFDGLRRGQHHLRLELDGYYPQSVLVTTFEPDDNYLREKITLIPRTELEPPQPISIGTSYIPRFTKTGAPPTIETEALPWSRRLGPTTSHRAGWIYLGSKGSGGGTVGDLMLESGLNLKDRIVHTSAPTVMWSDVPEPRLFRGFELGHPEIMLEAGSTLTISSDYREVGDGEFWAVVYVADDT